MVAFPADIIIDILSKLPVTSLLRFRTISKSSQSLIDSDHFKTLHVTKFCKSKSKLIICDSLKLYAVNFPTLTTTVNLNKYLKCFEDIIGSCNGLLCIKTFRDDLAIWNPSLCKRWILPRHFPDTFDVLYGFGFDPSTGDYKLVTIPRFINLGGPNRYEVSLFSCKTNSWKTLPNIMPFALPPWLETNPTGVFIDHALHWGVVKGDLNYNRQARPNLIVAFDLQFEEFNEVPLPQLGEGFEIDVSHLGNCLSIVVRYQNQNTGTDIWVMKQYGCKDSWIKLLTLVQSPRLIFSNFVKKPLGYYSDDDVLFEEKGHTNKLFWYNLKSKQVSLVTIPGISNVDAAIICVESLVQPPFPSGAAKTIAGFYKF